MCNGTKGIGEGAAGHVTCPRTFKSGVTSGFVPPTPLFVTELGYRELTVRQTIHFFSTVDVDKPNHNQFHIMHCHTCLLIIARKIDLNFLHQIINVSYGRVVRAARWKAKGRWFDSRRRHIFFILNFCLLPVSHRSKTTIQMKSSTTFIQSNGCTEMDLILKNIGGGLYDDTSAFKAL